MPNVRISQAADAGTLLSSDMLPLARSGNTNAYHTTMSSVATFTNASLSSGAYGNIGRNLLHNPLFNIAQRGAGPFNGPNVGIYTLDRWMLATVTDTGVSVSQIAFTDAARAAVGDEAAAFALQLNTTGNAAAGAYTEIIQPIEGVRRLGGKTVTLSFWAVGSAAGLKLGLNGVQNFGTGGSPSASVPIQATGTAVTLATTWARYSATFTVPSTSGKTLGTNNNDCTQLQIWLSSGATNNAQAGNIGVQSGTANLWGVQLEVGSVATPLDYGGSPADQLRQCQRFYSALTARVTGYAGAGGQAVGFAQTLPTAMRAIPTLTPNFGTQSNGTGTVAAPDANTAYVYITATAAGAVVLQGSFTASADL